MSWDGYVYNQNLQNLKSKVKVENFHIFLTASGEGGGQPKRSAWPLFSRFFFDDSPYLNQNILEVEMLGHDLINRLSWNWQRENLVSCWHLFLKNICLMLIIHWSWSRATTEIIFESIGSWKAEKIQRWVVTSCWQSSGLWKWIDAVRAKKSVTASGFLSDFPSQVTHGEVAGQRGGFIFLTSRLHRSSIELSILDSEAKRDLQFHNTTF